MIKLTHYTKRPNHGGNEKSNECDYNMELKIKGKAGMIGSSNLKTIFTDLDNSKGNEKRE